MGSRKRRRGQLCEEAPERGLECCNELGGLAEPNDLLYCIRHDPEIRCATRDPDIAHCGYCRTHGHSAALCCLYRCAAFKRFVVL